MEIIEVHDPEYLSLAEPAVGQTQLVPKVFVDMKKVRVYRVPIIALCSFFLLLAVVAPCVLGGLYSQSNSSGMLLATGISVALAMLTIMLCFGVVFFMGYRDSLVPQNFEFTFWHKIGFNTDLRFNYTPAYFVRLRMGEFIKSDLKFLTFSTESASNVSVYHKYLRCFNIPRITSTVRPIRRVEIDYTEDLLPYDMLQNGKRDKEIPYEAPELVLCLHQVKDARGRSLRAEIFVIDVKVMASVMSPVISGPKYSKEEAQLRVRTALTGRTNHVMLTRDQFLSGADIWHDCYCMYEVIQQIQSAPAPVQNLN